MNSSFGEYRRVISDTFHKALQDFSTQGRKIAKNSSEGKIFQTKLVWKNVPRYTSKQILFHCNFLSNRPEFQRIPSNGYKCIKIQCISLANSSLFLLQLSRKRYWTFFNPIKA